MREIKLVRVTTVPISLHLLLRGQFRYMHEHGLDVYTVSADGMEIPEVLKEGVPHFIVPLTRQITPVQDLISLIKMIRLFRKIRPDIVHTHTPKAGLIGMLAAWWCRVPVRLHTVAGLPLMEATGVKRWVLEQVEKITYNAANKVYVNSQGLLDFIIKDLHVSTEKVSIVGKGSSNGIDATYFSRTPELQKISDDIKMKWNISPGTFVFCFVGRIVRDKGIGELVRAFRRLVESQQNRQYKLLLIGPFESALDPLDADDFRYLNESSDVILAGFQKDVRPWMMAANAFIFPSYREGFPNVVLQASCLELPSIVSDINGCNEIIQHGKTGWVVPVKDANALYDAMVELVGNTDRAQHISRLARQYVVAHFDQQYIWGELLKIYTTMINERQP